MEEIKKYAHSAVHMAVLKKDHTALRRILSGLPRLPKAGEVTTEGHSEAAEKLADIVAGTIDRRDVPHRETALHVAVRMGDTVAVDMLMSAGADWSLQNAGGWNALQEAVCARQDAIAVIMTRHYQPLAWAKWCRRLPRLVASATRMRDFYMEMSFHFESSVIPFIGRIAPSDTYRIWKRGANLRADMTLAGFDGFRIQRSDMSFLFLGAGGEACGQELSSGTLLVLSHKEKEVSNALEGAGVVPSDNEVAHEVAAMSQTNLYRPGIDVTQAELVPRLNWRRQERSEHVGAWKAKIFDMVNVHLSVKSRRVPGALTDEELFNEANSNPEENEFLYDGILTPDERRQLDVALSSKNLNEDEESVESFESDQSSKRNGWLGMSGKSREKGSKDGGEVCNGESEGKGKKEKGSKKKKGSSGSSNGPAKQESEYKKGLRPVLWLTRDFPLRTEEFLPLLDILANKVKAVQRLRELLTTKLPTGTFPVKVAIPVVPTIRVVITFTKFEELQSGEEFTTPPSSPDLFHDAKGKDMASMSSSGSWMSWMKGSHQRMPSESKCFEDQATDDYDPFHIPSEYKWVSMNEKKRRMKAKKSKSKKDHAFCNGDESLGEVMNM